MSDSDLARTLFLYATIHILGVTVAFIGLFLPYTSSITPLPLGENSIVSGANSLFYETPSLGYQHFLGKMNVFIVFFLSLFFFLATKRWHRYFLIPIVMLYLASLIILNVYATDGFGRPYGDIIHIGFFLMLAGTIVAFLSSVFRPIVEIPNNSNQPLDSL